MTGVVGASARAAVMTLARAGEPCWAIDLFNDRDLKRLAPCARCPLDRFPHAIPALAEQFPPGPVMYTGGLENYPDVVAELARSRTLIGNDAETVQRIRDPFNLPNRPRTLPSGSAIPANGRWLIKSLRSSGGLGVRAATPGEIVPPGHYAQEFIDGPAMSAVFHDEKLLGVTEQLIGTPWLYAKEFHYAGTLSLVPTLCVGTLLSTLCVAESAQGRDAERPKSVPTQSVGTRLIGHYGIDFILNDDRPFIIEINPRYPASLEVIEFANHLHCTVGKAIWFAPHTFRFPDSGPWDADLAGTFDPWRLPGFADIPEPGARFEAGWPVITFFATGATAEECRGRLQSRASELDRLFAGTDT